MTAKQTASSKVKLFRNMRITLTDVKKKRVETQSGVYIGKVTDVILDIEQYSVVQFKVQHGFKRQTLLIHPGQIKRIEEKRIIVIDAVMKELEAETESPIPAKAEQVAMREQN